MDPSSDVELAPPDLAACRAILRRGSKSFALASLLLPSRVRDPAAALYAFCREADDLVDGDRGPDGLRIVRERLAAIARGEPGASPVDRAVTRVVFAHQVPPALLESLIEGFSWDTEGRCYETIEAVLDYAARVAGSVGVMMTLLMGPRDAATLARAADLGLAMQLTNIARDVGEDAAIGRIYLPRDWLREAGIADDVPAAVVADPRIDAVVLRLLAFADELYASASEGVDRLPRDCRSAIRSASSIYREIGARIRARCGSGRIFERAVVPAWQKIGLAIAAATTPSRPLAPPRPARREVQFLLDLAEAT